MGRLCISLHSLVGPRLPIRKWVPPDLRSVKTILARAPTRSWKSEISSHTGDFVCLPVHGSVMSGVGHKIYGLERTRFRHSPPSNPTFRAPRENELRSGSQLGDVLPPPVRLRSGRDQKGMDRPRTRRTLLPKLHADFVRIPNTSHKRNASTKTDMQIR